MNNLGLASTNKGIVVKIITTVEYHRIAIIVKETIVTGTEIEIDESIKGGWYNLRNNFFFIYFYYFLFLCSRYPTQQAGGYPPNSHYNMPPNSYYPPGSGGGGGGDFPPNYRERYPPAQMNEWRERDYGDYRRNEYDRRPPPANS